MKFFGNILWIIIGGGIFIFLFYLLVGVLLCITIIGIPFGTKCIKLSFLVLMPLGREVVQTNIPMSTFAIIMNLIWIIFAGLELALIHLFLMALFAISIIGIPFAKQHSKLIILSLMPFGHELKIVV